MHVSSKNYRVRPATEHDLPGLMHMRGRSIDRIKTPEYNRQHIELWRDANVIDKYHELLELNCLWVLGPRGKPLASSGLRMNTLELVAVFVDPNCQGNGYAQRMVAKAEQVAASYGIIRLLAEASLNAANMYQRLGYVPGKELAKCDRLGLPCREMHKNLLSRQTQYQKQVWQTLERLGINQNYGIQHQLPIQTPPKRLTSAGKDCFDRSQRLTPMTLKAWQKMRAAAGQDNMELQMVSAYRDLDYQIGIVQRKLEQGQLITDILKVSAAPGFSEHHTGRAMDLNTPDCIPVEDEFADTDAYQWLQQNAGHFGFIESYPQNNIHKIAWEPWHWCYQGTVGADQAATVPAYR